MKEKCDIYKDGFTIRRKSTRVFAYKQKDLWIIEITRFSKEERSEKNFEVFIKRMGGTLTVKKIVFYELMVLDIINAFIGYHKHTT